MPEIFILLAGYAMGCLQSAYFAGRLVKKIDIREHGSGNAGTTNAVRVIGFKAGLVVLFFDLGKTVLAVMLANQIFNGRLFGLEGIEHLPGLLAGLGVVLGHNFPFYLKFRGGKGVAASLVLVLMFDWRILVVVAVASVFVIMVTKYVSLASLTGFAIFPIYTAVLGQPIEITAVACAIGLLGFIAHRKNIVRLLKGEEKKFDLKRLRGWDA